MKRRGIALAALGGNAGAQTADLLTDDFEGDDALTDWALTGDWRVKENSACLPNSVGYISPVNSLAFDFGSECSYRNNRSGFATLTFDVLIPTTMPSATLEWWDFVGAEVGSDFYFVQVSENGGASWVDVFRESKDEKFWDQETADLTDFIGKSIRIRFGFLSDDSVTGLGWYIDDVRIFGETLDENVSAVAIGAATVAEGDSGTSELIFTVTISPPVSPPAVPEPIVIEHETVDGSAIAGQDYVARSGRLTIPAGATVFQIPVVVNGESFSESDETLSLILSNASENAHITIASAVGIIEDDEALVDLPIVTGVTVEDWEVRPQATPWASTGTPVPLWHLQASSDCIEGENGFSSPTRAMVFNNGEGSCTYDTVGGTSGELTMTGTVKIPDSALTAQVSFKDYLEVAYTTLGATPTSARVEISAGPGLGFTWETLRELGPTTPSPDVQISPWPQTEDDIDVINLDAYIDLDGLPNTTVTDIKIRFVFEQPDEPTRTDATGWYVDDITFSYAALPAGVSKVKVSPPVAAVNEGTSGSTIFTFPIKIAPANASDIVLAYDTVEKIGANAATEDSDFVGISSQKLIPAGVTDSTINVLLIGEDLPEPNEVFRLLLSNVSSNSFLVNTEVEGVITNDDTPSTFSVTYQGGFDDIPNLPNPPTPVAIELPEATGTATIDLTIDTPRSVPIDVDFVTFDGTANSGTGLDFLAVSGTLHFPANSSNASFTIPILNDQFFEDPGAVPTFPEINRPPEDFTIVLNTDSPYAQGREKSVVIRDDDSTQPLGTSILIVDDVTVTEGSCPDISAPESCGSVRQATFTITLDIPPSALAVPVTDIKVAYHTNSITANGDEDFESVEGEVTFSRLLAETSKTVTIPIFADRAVEDAETFELRLSPVMGTVYFADNSGIATIGDDDYAQMTFGAAGTEVIPRELDNDQPENPVTILGTVSFTSNDFEGFNFDKLYGWDAADNALKSVNLVTGALATIATHALGAGEFWSGLAWDHTNGFAYATRTDGELHRVNLASGAITLLSTSARNLVAAAVHPSTGRIYAVDVVGTTRADLVYTVPGDWAWHLVGTLTNVTPAATDSEMWSMDFDDTSGALYLNAFTNDGAADSWFTLKVDVSNAAASIFLAAPPVSPIAIATPPPPFSVQWTKDIDYASAPPEGYQLVADTDALPPASEAGTKVSGVGDINGDGYEDFAVAAPKADALSGAGAGKVFIFYGGTSSDAVTRLNEFAHGDVEFGDDYFDGNNGVVISGAIAGERLGTSVSGAGDANGDDIADFVIGYVEFIDVASIVDEKGGAYIVFGRPQFPPAISAASIGDLSLGATIAGVKFVGAAFGDKAGTAVAGAGDFNADGFSDVVIGAPGAQGGLIPAGVNAGPVGASGAAYVVFGSDSGTRALLNLSSLQAPAGVRILGAKALDKLGSDISGVGDINGDGVDDIVLGAPGASSGTGAAYAFFGHLDYQEDDAPNPIDLGRTRYDVLSPARPSLMFTAIMPPEGDLAKRYIDPLQYGTSATLVGFIPGLQIVGEGAGAGFGSAIAAIGDMNGDSVDEFAIGAPGYNGSVDPVEVHTGRTYVVFGGDNVPTPLLASGVSVAVPGLLLTGIDGIDETGSVLAGGGDINGDGYMDLLIGAPGARPGAFQGEAYFLFGGAGLGGRLSLRDLGNPDSLAQKGLYVYSTHSDANFPGAFDFGMGISSAGDFNDDSISDIVAGRNGGAFVLFGEGQGASAEYRNRMRSGKSILAEFGGPDLGKEVEAGVGFTGDGSFNKPASRASMMFKGGGFGADLVQASTQRVTLYREAAPDVAVGTGSPEDDARWIPSNVHWKVETNRSEFTQSVMEFHYRPEEVEGFDLQKVGVFYAKPNQDLSETSAWSWLPFTHDPDRRVFTVYRSHDAEAAQVEFNGYYALIQADLLTYLGGVIPSVGVASENVYQYGPDLTPTGFAFWHTRDKRLYAVREGLVNIRWKDNLGNVVSEVQALNLWPTDPSIFQDHVSGTPAVGLNPSGGPLEFLYSELTAHDNTVIVDPEQTSLTLEQSVRNNRLFAAKLKLNALPVNSPVDDPALTGRSLILLSTKAEPGQGDIYFQFVRTIKYNNPALYIVGPLGTGIPLNVGTPLTRTTDGTFAAKHDERSGSPFIFFDSAPYLPETPRYPGFYNRTTRTGTIVAINEVRPGMSDIVVAYYDRGAKLIDPKTGNPARVPVTNQFVEIFDWPHAAAKYKIQWPTPPASAEEKIVISSQKGTGSIDEAVFGDLIDVYVQNNPALKGFNPNEEHALVAPYGAGQAVFALRDDLNADENRSQPWVLMTYYDPNDIDINGDPRAKVKAFHVVKEQAPYRFRDWAGVSGDDDPYEGEVANLILPPYPLSLFLPSRDNTSTQLPQPGDTPAQARARKMFKDRNGSLWAKRDGDIPNRFYYPAMPDFYFPQAYLNKHRNAVPSRVIGVGGRDVPWLDGGGVAFPTSRNPIDVVFTVRWPAVFPTMGVGEILIEARDGLPQIDGQCSVDFIFEQAPNIAKLIDPVQVRQVDANLDAMIATLSTEVKGGEKVFTDLPPALFFRISYDDGARKLKMKGIHVVPVSGATYVLLNVLNAGEYRTLRALSNHADWVDAVDDLFVAASHTLDIDDSDLDPADVLALTTGDAQGTGFIVVAMQNAASCAPLPVSLEVIMVEPGLTPGGIAIVNPSCVFDEKLTLLHKNDFGGRPENFSFEWYYMPDNGGLEPPVPSGANPLATVGGDGRYAGQAWKRPPLNTPVSGNGVNSIAIVGPGLLTLTDNWFAVRYKSTTNPTLPWHNQFSEFTHPQFAEGWLKRVVGDINPFNQRATGGGIEGAESSFASFGNNTVNTLVSMISQAGPRYAGNVALNCNDLDSLGLIPIYETVLDRGRSLSIDALSPLNHPGVNQALLLVASRVSDLYMLLGNEAYADAEDPTIAFGTDDGTYGAYASSIHPFMNQTSSLLEEELALLRGRDDIFSPRVDSQPVYNRLTWNFTIDMRGGEVAYALNYNILDGPVGEFPPDGVIDEADAKRLYPQGHGDAWGHYLKAMKAYYALLAHPFYAWSPRTEGILVGGQAVTVDFIDERRFAAAAAAKARTGQEIVNLAYREEYVEDPSGNWQGYRDPDPDRAWGFSDWASRAGQGAYIDWVTGNAILRAQILDADDDRGILHIDRTTVPELAEVAAAYTTIEATADAADLGLNPLGLGTNVIPFDISPSLIDDGLTHFEQIEERAVTAVSNAAVAFNRATNSTQLLRQQQDSQLAFERGVEQQEIDINSRLIEIYGYPYPEDIGPGKTYATGYNGPDIYHFMYDDDNGLRRDGVLDSVYFADPVAPSNDVPPPDIPSLAESQLANYAEAERVTIGEGDIQFNVNVVNYDVIQPRVVGNTALVNYLREYYPNITVPGSGSGLVSAVQMQTVPISYNMSNTKGRFGITKPAGFSERRAPGELQTARAELNQALAAFMIAIDDYSGLAASIEHQAELIDAQYGLTASQLTLLSAHSAKRVSLQQKIYNFKIAQFALNTAATIIEKLGESAAEAIPTVTGFTAGFSIGIEVDLLAPVRGILETVAVIAAEALKIVSEGLELGVVAAEQEQERVDDKLTFDQAGLDGNFALLEKLKELEELLGAEIPARIGLHTSHAAITQAMGEYLKVVAEADRLIEGRTLFRRQTAADVQSQRYRDMAFRIFRNDALQKYRAQFDLAARFTFLAAKAYDYETTLLSSDPMSGSRFLTNIVRARQIGAIEDGLPQTGVGLADSLAVMGRNFDVLFGQLGFNNPQAETNRFSLRHELFRVLPAPEGDEAWREVLAQDYFANGAGTVGNLWDVPEFREFCVPPAEFGAVEPGIVIPFTTTIEEGKNFFGRDSGGLDSSYDSTQFATKIRSVGVWFSGYDALDLSNTPRVYLVPAGTDTLRSPTGFRGQKREFKVLDQIMPIPFPIGTDELDDPSWIPSVNSLAGSLTPIRRFGRFRAYHDSGEFSIEEMQRDSRLVGRSVWNSRWMLIIPASTLGAPIDPVQTTNVDERLDLFIRGPEVGGERTGEGVSDLKIFFETYAYPRLKKSPGTDTVAVVAP